MEDLDEKQPKCDSSITDHYVSHAVSLTTPTYLATAARCGRLVSGLVIAHVNC